MADHTGAKAVKSAGSTPGDKREDVLEAVKLRAAVSTSLLTAAGTTGAAGIALIAFASGLHRVPLLAAVVWSIAGITLFASALYGGRAIRCVSANGAKGNWNLVGARQFWRVQVWAFIGGVVLLTVGSVVAFSGPSRSSGEREQDRLIVSFTASQREQEGRIASLTAEISDARMIDARIQREIRQLKRALRAPRR
jgi:hypothetical protein